MGRNGVRTARTKRGFSEILSNMFPMSSVRKMRNYALKKALRRILRGFLPMEINLWENRRSKNFLLGADARCLNNKMV